MKIKVKAIDGRDAEFDISEQAPLSQLRSEITENLGVPDDRMRLIFQGKHLDNVSQSLQSYGIRDGLVVHLVERPPNIEPLPAGPNDDDDALGGDSMFDLGPEVARLNDLMMGMQHRNERALGEQTGVVHTNVPLIRNEHMRERSHTEAVVRRAISEMTYIPEELRNRMTVQWRDNGISIQVPQLQNPHVASPAMERVHLVEGALQNVLHFFTVSEEEGGLVSVVDNLLEGVAIEDATLRQNAIEFALRLEDVPPSAVRRGTGQSRDSPDLSEGEADARFQTVARMEGHQPYVMRHVLASDLVELLGSLRDYNIRLGDHIERYRRILTANMVFNINNRQQLATDGRGNILSVYMEHVQRTLHRMSHATHVLSDLNIHLEDPLPRRLFPQYGNFDLPSHVQGEVTLEIIDPSPTRNRDTAHEVTANTVFHNPSPANDVVLHPNEPTLMTLYPTGIVQQVATMSIPVTGPDAANGMNVLDQLAGAVRNGTQPRTARGTARAPTAAPAPPPPPMSHPVPSASNGGTGSEVRHPTTIMTRDQLETVAASLATALRANRSAHLPVRESAENVFEDVFGQLVDLTTSLTTAVQGSQQGGSSSSDMMAQLAADPLQLLAPLVNITTQSMGITPPSTGSAQPPAAAGHVRRSVVVPAAFRTPAAPNAVVLDSARRNAQAQFLLGQGMPPAHFNMGGADVTRPATVSSPTGRASSATPASTTGMRAAHAEVPRPPVPHTHRHHHAPLHTHPHHHHHMHHHHVHHHSPAMMGQGAGIVLPPGGVDLSTIIGHHNVRDGYSTQQQQQQQQQHVPRADASGPPPNPPRRSRSVPREVMDRIEQRLNSGEIDVEVHVEVNEAGPQGAAAAAGGPGGPLPDLMDRMRDRMSETEANLQRAEERMRNARNRLTSLEEIRVARAAAAARGRGRGGNTARRGGTPQRGRPMMMGMGATMHVRPGLANGNDRPSTTINEEVIPVDPFLQCSSRFSRPSRGVPGHGHGSHYQQVVGDRVPPRTRRRPVPEEYTNLRLSVNSSGDLILSEEDSQLVSIVQLALRSLISSMRESDSERTARASGPVNNVLQNLGLGMGGQAMMGIGMGIGMPAAAHATIQIEAFDEDEEGNPHEHHHHEHHPHHHAMDLANPHVVLPGIRPEDFERYNVNMAPQPMETEQQQTAASNLGSRVPDVTPSLMSPRAKKRKTDLQTSQAKPSHSREDQTSSVSGLPPAWRSIVDADVERQRDLATTPPRLSAGYLMGLPPQARTASSPSSSSLTRSESMGGVLDTLDHLTVDSTSQSPATVIDDDALD